MTASDDQASVLGRIAEALVEATPEHWSAARLRVERTGGGEITGLRHSIESPEGHGELVFPTDELMAATTELDVLMEARGRAFSQADIEVRLSPEGDWRYTADFSYA